MNAATESVDIVWFAIIGVPTFLGYIAGCWHQRDENRQNVERVRRMYRRERELADALADDLFMAGRTDTETYRRYEMKRGR